MEKFKVIRDAIHGDIELSRFEVCIIDNSAFQRLRRIKQLGVTNLVYPGANHTRFEHALGALYLASKIAKKLSLSEYDEIILRAAALLHDIGHGPLSHTSEELLDAYANCSHEDMNIDIIKENFEENFKEHGVGIKDVLALLSPKKQENVLGSLISGDVDVDRMDYLVRDAYYTGVGYGIIDLDRLVNTIKIVDSEVVVDIRGIRAAEGLLVARFLMTPSVYLHKTSRIADAMFLRAMANAIEEKLITIEQLHKMDDYDIVTLLRSSHGYIREIGERFDKRKLFKLVKSFSYNMLGAEEKRKILRLKKNFEMLRKAENEFAKDCGIEEGYLILDILPLSLKTDINIKVFDGKEKVKLPELSPLVKILQQYYKSQLSFALYTNEKNVGKVLKKADGIFEYI